MRKARAAVDFCFCCCFCFLLFAKFFSPTCLRIHDVQIIVSILEILRFAAAPVEKEKKKNCSPNEKGAPAKDYRAGCLGTQRATGVAKRQRERDPYMRNI